MSDIQQGLADSIAMLEQILEVMPKDVDALKALYTANLQSGDPERAFEYLTRLLEVAAGAGDPELFSYLEGELAKFEESHPSEVAAHKARIRTLFGVHKITEGISQASARPAETQDTGSSDADISEELAFAWRLYEENQLSQDDYSSVLHDLTEVSSRELDVPISVLHVLSDRGFANLTRVMAFASSRSGLPFISMNNFEIDEKAAQALPLDFPVHEGALPFGYVGNDLMVAVLNPFNSALMDQIETESGHRCHVFLIDPEDYDRALTKLRSIVSSAT